MLELKFSEQDVRNWITENQDSLRRSFLIHETYCHISKIPSKKIRKLLREKTNNFDFISQEEAKGVYKFFSELKNYSNRNTQNSLSQFVFFADRVFSPEKARYYNLRIDLNYNSPSIPENKFINRDVDLPEILLKKDYLINVFNPIINNVYEFAFDKGEEGLIKVRGKDSNIQDKFCYEVSIEDNGKGILSTNLGKIFNKGFTTRENKTNHGIGLWAVKEFVKQDGGKINVESKINNFTRFNIKIPCVKKSDKFYIQG